MTDHVKMPVDGTPQAGAGSEPAPKKPYEPPRVVSHSALEVVTVSCSPRPPGKGEGVCTFANS